MKVWAKPLKICRLVPTRPARGSPLPPSHAAQRGAPGRRRRGGPAGARAPVRPSDAVRWRRLTESARGKAAQSPRAAAGRTPTPWRERRPARPARRRGAAPARARAATPRTNDGRQQIGRRRKPERGRQILRRQEHQDARAGRDGRWPPELAQERRDQDGRRRHAAPAPPRANGAERANPVRPGEQPPERASRAVGSTRRRAGPGRTARMDCATWRANARKRWSSPKKVVETKKGTAATSPTAASPSSAAVAVARHGDRRAISSARRRSSGVLRLTKLSPPGSSAASVGVVEPDGRQLRQQLVQREPPAGQARVDDGARRERRSERRAAPRARPGAGPGRRPPGARSRSAASSAGDRNGRSPARQTTASASPAASSAAESPASGPAPATRSATTSTPRGAPRGRIVGHHQHAREDRPQDRQLPIGHGLPGDLQQRFGRAAQPTGRAAGDDRGGDAPHGYGQGALARRATPCRTRIICSCKGPLLASTRPVSPSNGVPSRSVACPPAPMDDRRARHQVPGVQRPLPVAVEPAGGDEAEIERRRAEPPRPLRRRRERRPLGQVVLHGIARVRKAGHQQRAPQPIGARRRDRLAVQRRAAAR